MTVNVSATMEIMQPTIEIMLRMTSCWPTYKQPINVVYQQLTSRALSIYLGLYYNLTDVGHVQA